ncbi:hypothetical protein H0H87_007111 [Tephrocybe sp. NHM501043]|nr:hypothetical protein H0H87_007111 [Tephrocybe sp. NHM501043]
MLALLPLLLAAGHSVLPLFDAAPRLAPSPLAPLVRWDAVHFSAIAHSGYAFDIQWAFLPGTPFLIRLLRFNTNPYIWPLALLALALDSARTLHRLTRHFFPTSPSFARLVLLLSLFPSSPATLYFAPYAEPFFTYLSYRGMLFAAQQRWLAATLCFTLASFFRSNGILLAGYLMWGLVALPFLNRRQPSALNVLYAIILSACVAAPLVYHNYSAYLLFCMADIDTPEWCHRVPPSIYTHVQAKYWDNGFLRYWTPAQIPNFIIGAPPLVLLIVFSVHNLRKTFLPAVTSRLFGGEERTETPLETLAITPHLIHSLVMCITLLFFSHTQIVLRLAAALPALYWAAAWLFIREGRWGRVWVRWSIVWGLISVGLWVAFLPPA